MSEANLQMRARLLDLLADEAVQGLSDAERAERDRLLLAFPELDAESFARAAAAADLALDPTTAAAPLSDSLRARLEADALRVFAESEPTPPATREPSAPTLRTVPSTARESSSLRSMSRSATWAGWVVAAAAAMTAIFVILPDAEPIAPAPSGLRAELLADEIDTQTLAWTATDDPAASGASGDVVWSDAAQEGYMRFRGLAVNDPEVEQYQLWIFDAERDEARPVDGGVFDVASADTDVVVSIDAKLPVSRATLFAVTVERPGGVVVSSRERLPLLAKVPSG